MATDSNHRLKVVLAFALVYVFWGSTYLGLKVNDRAAVHFGGPVQIDRGFVLHRPLGNWQSTLAINDTLGLTTSKDVLEAAGRGEGPKDMFVSLGYAGWSAGQLEMELAQNAWLTVEADPDVVFELPAEGRLPAAVRLLGIDISRLSDTAGHG